MGIGGVSVGLGAELAQEPQHADAPPEATPQPGTKGFSMFFLLLLGKEIFVSFEQFVVVHSQHLHHLHVRCYYFYLFHISSSATKGSHRPTANQKSSPFLQLLLLVSQIVSKYASSFGYSVHRNTTISIIMLIYSNNWPF